MKKRIILALTLLMILGFSGCGRNKEGENSETAAASKDYVYKMQDIELGEGNQQVSQLLVAGETVFAYGYEWSSTGEDSSLVFYRLAQEGTVEKSYKLPVGVNTSINRVAMDEDENIYCIKNEYHPVSQETDPETGEVISVSDEYVDDYFLVKMSLEGEEFFSVKLNDIPELKQMSQENDYFYVGDMVFDQEKGIYVNASGSFVKFDLDGNYIGIISKAEEQNPFNNASFIPLNDGRIAAVIYEENKISVAAADMEKGTFGEKYSIPGLSYEYSFYPGIGYDLYLTNSYGLYGYNLGDADKTQIISYIDSDFGFYNLYQLTAISSKEFFATYDDMEMGGSILAKFTKVEPEDVKEKQVITLAMSSTNWSVRQWVVKFNKANENYRISILDYNSMYGSDTDYNAGLTRLNTDIISGKVPDILLLDNAMPVESYINKGLFEDFKPYIEKDRELSMDNFMPNIIEAFSVDGKLYSLVPSYSIQTLVAKASDVGTERGWTVQEAREILASKPEGTQFLVNVTRDEMLRNCMSMAGNQFVDWETGSCSFDSEDFIQMLEFIGTFPERIDQSEMTDDFWNNYDSMWREGKVLTSMVYMGEFRNFNYMEKGTFGEESTIIGFPSANKDGSVIYPDLQFAMSAKSKNKEGAWEFLRTYLMDDYQENNVTYTFPLSIRRLDELAAKAMEKPYYMDENNNKVEYDDTCYVAGIEIIISPMTKQETDKLKEQLYSFTNVYKYDESLLKIIEEEAAPYFAGQKSVKDVASVIQSRAQIYVNENR